MTPNNTQLAYASIESNPLPYPVAGLTSSGDIYGVWIRSAVGTQNEVATGTTNFNSASWTVSPDVLTTFIDPVTKNYARSPFNVTLPGMSTAAIDLAALSISGSMAGTVSDVLWSVGYVNVLVAIFNMLPGLPLDGGRVFRAIIWQVTGREETGVRIAAWIGRATAVGVVGFALLGGSRGSQIGINLAIALLVGWFLWQGASDALHHAGRTTRINLLVARTLADRTQSPPSSSPRLAADLRGAPLLQAMAANPADTYALTEPDGSVYGTLTARAVDDAYRASR